MFRSHPGGWSAARQAVFALLPFVIGAGVLVAGGDGQVTGMSRLEVTQSFAPQAVRAPAPAIDMEVAAPAPAATLAPAATVTTAGGAPAPVEADGVGPAAVEAGEVAPAAVAAAGTGAPGAVAAEIASPTSTSSPARSSVPATTAPSTSSSTTTTTTAPAPASSGRARDAEAEVVPLTNADRAAAGLGTLSRNACLDAAAAGFAEQMARRGVLAHNPGAGPAVTDCRANATWGDNVGMSTACDTALLEREWMASPSHRRNILIGAFTLIGVGAWTDDTGTCWVQVLFSS